MTDKEVTYLRELPVRKSNLLIQQSRYTLSARQFDLITHLASLIKPENKPGTIYNITISELCRVCGWDKKNGGNYRDIKEQLDTIDRLTKWIKQEDGREVRFRWFDRLEMEEGSGTITVSFHSTIEPYLYGVERRFTQYIAECIYAMKSKYSKFLYDWLKSYERQGHIGITLEDFSKYVCPNDYPEYKGINQWIITPALKEINEMTDITVKCEAKKTHGSRKTNYLLFTIIPVNSGIEESVRAVNRDISLDGYKEETAAEEDELPF